MTLPDGNDTTTTRGGALGGCSGRPASWLGLDIGGANIKAVHSSGQARTIPFELWKRPGDLPIPLGNLALALPPAQGIALTMTAELCDCFTTRAIGVRTVLQGATATFPGLPLKIWGVDEAFHDPPEIMEAPLLAAAANWLALANVAARLVPQGPALIIDIGSTTTDIIPALDGRPCPRGRTDTKRLRTGELVYAGVVRTPICALMPEVAWKGGTIGLAAELFATTLDVYLTLGRISEDPYNLATADGRPSTVDAARNRLARMIGADRDSFSPEDARSFALAANEVLLNRLEDAARRACGDIGPPRAAVISGSGSFLAQSLAQRLLESPDGPIIDLHQAWSPAASTAACAYALVVLASEQVFLAADNTDTSEGEGGGGGSNAGAGEPRP